MGSLNKLIVAGQLVADPELKYNSAAEWWCWFKLRVRGKEKQDTINCVVWGGLARICGEYLKKGKLVAVEGRIRVMNKKTEFVVENMQMLDSKFHKKT